MATLRRLSRFEWTVIVAVIGVALASMAATEAQSERLAVTLTIRNIRTGLRLAVAEKLMHGEEDRMAELLDKNPLDFIEQPVDGSNNTWGDWRYDARHHELIYRPLITLAFDDGTALRWRIEASPEPGGRMNGVRLVDVQSP